MDRLLRLAEVKAITGLSGATIWRMQETGKFPKRVKINNWSVAWRESEIQDWIANLKPPTEADSERYHEKGIGRTGKGRWGKKDGH
jgi:predicted DNA-binding transcriptional regulator AlpA